MVDRYEARSVEPSSSGLVGRFEVVAPDEARLQVVLLGNGTVCRDGAHTGVGP